MPILFHHLFKQHSPSSMVSALFLTGVAIGLANCAGGPVNTNARHTIVQNTQAQNPQDQSPQASAAWWGRFGDPQLDMLMAKAHQNAPSLAEASARIERANAGYAMARSKTLPILTGRALALGIASEQAPPIDGLTFTGLNFSYELDFWGRNKALLRHARSNKRAIEAAKNQAELMLTTSIMSAYIDLEGEHEDLEFAQYALKLKQESLSLQQQRFEQGLSSKIELETAIYGLDKAREATFVAQAEIELTHNRLSALIGLDPSFGVSIARPQLKPLDERGQVVPERIDLNLIGQRPDVEAAKWRVEAASGRIDQAHAEFYPNINLSAVIGHIGLEGLMGLDQSVGNYGPAISLPLFQGGRLKAQLHGAKSEYEEALAGYNGAVINAMREVADVVVQQKALNQRLDSAHKAFTAREEAFHLAKSRYGAGLSNRATVIASEYELLVEMRHLWGLKIYAYKLNVALTKALGG